MKQHFTAVRERLSKLVRIFGMVSLVVIVSISCHGQSNQPARQVRNIILVHGAWADGSSWKKVIPILEQKGFHVTAVHLAFTSLANDAQTVKRELAIENGPTLLVAHSFGGVVITQAGDDPKVAGLVYLAAFAPNVGQSAADLNNEYPAPPGDKEFRADAEGFITLTDKGIAEDFAQDLPASEKKLLAATEGQVSGPNELGTKVTIAAWRSKPCFYVVADHDRMIAPKLEEKLAEQMHAKAIHIPSSHVVMLSHPAQVADFIARAAAGH